MSRRERREQQRQLEKFRREQQRIAAASPKISWWRTAFDKTYGLLGVIVLLFGLIGGWVLFHPHVSLRPDQRLNPNDPFSTQFTIVNEGNFDVRNLRSACTFGDVQTTHNVGMSGLTRPSLKTIPLIEPKQSSTVECPSLIGGIGAGAGNVMKADIALRVSYGQNWWPNDVVEVYRFEGKLDSNGIVHWIPLTLSE